LRENSCAAGCWQARPLAHPLRRPENKRPDRLCGGTTTGAAAKARNNPTMLSEKAYLHEVFSGIQGEGPLVGARQIFLRFCGCNLACRFCDTPESRGAAQHCSIEKIAGRREWYFVSNPLLPESLERLLVSSRFFEIPHHSISLTGGEPLVQVDFLAEALPILRAHLPIYLESNGTLPEALAKVLPHLDFIAMDIKLPSAAQISEHFSVHKEFLTLCRGAGFEVVGRGFTLSRAEGCHPPPDFLFVKIVVTADTQEEELLWAFSTVAEVDPEIEVILQPVSQVSGARDRGPAKHPTPQQVLRWQEMGLKRLRQVRVIPQIHRLMGQL